VFCQLPLAAAGTGIVVFEDRRAQDARAVIVSIDPNRPIFNAMSTEVFYRPRGALKGWALEWPWEPVGLVVRRCIHEDIEIS
jgi:hypothetical protein